MAATPATRMEHVGPLTSGRQSSVGSAVWTVGFQSVCQPAWGLPTHLPPLAASAHLPSPLSVLSTGTKEESTGDSCNYASATGKLYSGAPPSYDCACIQEGSAGLTWQQSACTAGSEPVSAPNICLVEKEDGTNLAMGWLDGATQTCAFPRNFSWAPTGLWTGFGGRLKMSQLCYSGAEGCATSIRC